MVKAVMISVSLLAMVLAGPALAQDTAPQGETRPPALASPAQGKAQAVPLFIPEQGSDQVLAKSLIGAQVVDISGNEVGTVKDLILDRQGNAVGVVVSWGGLLGIGAKEVAVSFGPAQLQDGEEPETKLVRLNVPREAIKAGPEFIDAKDRQTEAARANRSSEAGQPEGGR
jgi:hypothetical protein